MTVFSRTWRALGTSVHVLVTDVDLLPDAAASVSDVLGAVDRAYSRFRSDSELSFVNAHPGEPHAVSDLFADALAEALRASELSCGAVDPTVGRAMRLVGYVDDFAGVAPSAGPIALRGGGVLVSLGGDIATAGDVSPEGWAVLVAEDSAVPAEADGEVIALHGGAIATSST